jgi:hypothetical protein
MNFNQASYQHPKGQACKFPMPQVERYLPSLTAAECRRDAYWKQEAAGWDEQKIKMEDEEMFKIEITKDNGNRTIIEVENAAIIYGDVRKKDICILSKDGNCGAPVIADLITDAKNVFIEKSISEEDRKLRITGIAVMDMVNGMKFRQTISNELEKIQAEKDLKNSLGSMGFNFTRRPPIFPGF